MPQMASVLIKLTADWISGDIEACRSHHPETPRALGQLVPHSWKLSYFLLGTVKGTALEFHDSA